MSNNQQWIHFVGICSIISAGLAVAYKKQGYKVTGSDKAFFPPTSTYLQMNGIEVTPGYNESRLTDDSGSSPDLVAYSGVEGSSNPEIAAANIRGIKCVTFTQALADVAIHPTQSIVVTGTYGKTTIASLLVKIFQEAKVNASHMLGAIQADWSDTVSFYNSQTKYSIVEGDEYMVSLQNKVSKFFLYKPKYLVINALNWDHHDMFKTFDEYKQNFARLVESVAPTGLIVYNSSNADICAIVKNAHCKTVSYAANIHNSEHLPDWFLNRESKPLPTFIKTPQSGSVEIIPYDRQILGDFNDENFLAATAIAYELGIKKERIQEAILNFKGVKRRLEIAYNNSDDTTVVIDDFGSSSSKAEAALKSVKAEYPDHNITVVFEPNTGNRTLESVQSYSQNTFAVADKLIFCRFTRLPKIDFVRLDAASLAEQLTHKGINPEVIADDDELLKTLSTICQTQPKCVILFLGSHGFRGLIPKLAQMLNEHSPKNSAN